MFGLTMKQWVERCRSRETLRAFLTVLLAIAANMIAYYSAKVLAPWLHYFPADTAWDLAIPVIPVFVVFYIGAYFQWGFHWIRMIFTSDKMRYEYLSAEILGKLISMIFFLTLTITMKRPEVTGSDLFSAAVRIVYAADTPTCLFPSLHCFQSWLAMRYICASRWKRGYQIFSGVFTLGVVASTLLVKQHLIYDVFGGLLLAELVLLVSRKSALPRLLRRCMEGLVRRKPGEHQ